MNQVLSQSVGHGVIMGMKGIAKIYAGEIIEGARKVQEEWARIDEEKMQELTGVPRPEGIKRKLISFILSLADIHNPTREVLCRGGS